MTSKIRKQYHELHKFYDEFYGYVTHVMMHPMDFSPTFIVSIMCNRQGTIVGHEKNNVGTLSKQHNLQIIHYASINQVDINSHWGACKCAN